MRDDLDCVLLLASQIFVREFAARIATAADIDADIGDSMAGNERLHVHIALDRAIAAPVGHHLDNRRYPCIGQGTP